MKCFGEEKKQGIGLGLCLPAIPTDGLGLECFENCEFSEHAVHINVLNISSPVSGFQ